MIRPLVKPIRPEFSSGPCAKRPGWSLKVLKKSSLGRSHRHKICKNKLKEVIIATSATVEGQTTAHYIEDEIKNSEIKISKLGQGLPVGGEIEQLDDGTLVSAFKNRVPVSSE